MAQSGFTPIQLYFSSTSGATPLAANLANGELALNIADGILFYKDSSGVVEVLASGSSASILSVVAATTTNLASLSGLLTVDGVVLTAGQRVLVKNQTSSQNNGVYLASAGAWTRSIDANSSAEIAGRIITVRSGTTQGGQQWATTFKSTDTLGTTAMAWFQVALQNTAVTFTDLTTTGNTILGNASADTLTVNATSTFSAKPLVQLTTATTNAVTQVFRLDSQSSGTPANGIGVGMEFAVETTAGNTEVGATINAVTTDVTATSEDFDLVFNTMAGGAAVSEGLRVKNTGGVTIPTGGTYQINSVSVLSATNLGSGIVGTNQNFTAAQTFRAPSAVRSEAAATQDAVVLAGRAGGTSSFAVTLTPTTLTASRTLTLPDGDVTLPTGTYAVLGTAQTFTAAQTFRAANAVRSEAAATQDAIILAGRAGGTSSFAVSLTPTTLTANRTLTLPNVTDTVAVLGTAQTFSAAQTFSSTVTMSGTTTNIDIGTSQTTGTLTLGGTAQTGAITLGRSTGAQIIGIGTGVNTAATKTINIGTGSTGSGVTSIAVGPTNAASQVNSTGLLNLNGLWTAKSAVQGENGFSVENSPTGAFILPASVVIDAYTAADDGVNYTTSYLAGSLVWTTRNSSSETATLSIKTADGAAQKYSFYADPAINSFCLGVATSDLSKIYGISQNSFAIGGDALTTDQTTGIPSPIGVIAIGGGAGQISVAAATTPTIGFSNNNIVLGGSAGSISSSGGFSSSIGGDNVFIGPFAGRSDAATAASGIGDINIFIGYTAGNQTDKVLGNNNIGIGSSAGSNLPGGRNNVVVIGGNLAAESSAGSGDVLIGNGSGGLLLNGTWSSTAFSNLTLNENNALTLRSTGGLSFFDSEFRIIDNTDPTKVAVFEASGITTATTRTLTVPNASGTLALLSGTQTFSGTTTFSAAVTMSGTTVNYNIGTSQTTGTLTIGGTSGTGTITVGRSTGNQRIDLGNGVTAGGSTKTIDIGTNGATGSTTTIGIGTLSASGSTTTISLGSAVGGSTNTINLNGQTVIAAGTGSAVPARMTSGPLVGSVVAGAIEYDGNVFYGTADVTSGRGLWVTSQYFRLTTDGTAIGPAIANFFGGTSGKGLDTSAFYEVEYELYFTKTTAGTVTFTLTYSNAPINCNANYVGTPVGGVGTVGAPQTAALAKSTATASALPVTGSLTTAVNHQYTVKAIFQANATTGGTLNLQVTSSAGTVTPLTGSYYKITRLPAANTGSFV